VTLSEVSTINKSTTSYVYSQLGTVFLDMRQLNSTWLFVVPDVDIVTYKTNSPILSRKKQAKHILAWDTLGEGTRLIAEELPQEMSG